MPGRGRLYERVQPATIGHLRVLTARDVELDIDGHQVRWKGCPVHLPLKEFDVLRLLMDNAGRVLTRRELLDRVWGEGYPDTNKTIDVHITRIRRKIDCDDGPTRIRTVRGMGYIFDLEPW